MLKPPPAAPGSRTDYNALKAPSNYVPGLGRGATGFTTRSDIGPARAGPVGDGGDKEGGGEGADESKFDEFMGSDAGVFAGGTYDEDDKEADRVWESIDNFMDERRRTAAVVQIVEEEDVDDVMAGYECWGCALAAKLRGKAEVEARKTPQQHSTCAGALERERRERLLKERLEQMRADNPKITEQFADLKRDLAQVSAEEWEGIPDVGDRTIKKRPRFASFAPAPDSLLSKAAAATQMDSTIAADGLATPAGSQTTADLTAIGEGQRTVIKLKLDSMADSVSGQTVIDPKGYLTDLSSMAINSSSEISDIKKARELLKSVITTNPHHGPGWIAAARLEEKAGKLQVARTIITEGCERCATNEDVWLEAARLQPPEMAKAVLARGVANIPTSYKLWMAAARLEVDDAAKQRVLRRALERIPGSVRLWKAAVELASEEDARVLLSRAVECCPTHVELWLALARLESYDNAKKVLNKARQAVPTDPAIWITAAKLEEAQGNTDMVGKIIARALKSLQGHGVVIGREAWLKEAEAAERAQPACIQTCRSIVREVVGLGVDEEDRRRTWMGDAEEAARRGSIETARAVYGALLAAFPGKATVWRAAAALEKQHGSREALDELLKRAVSYCPQAEVLWLMAAKEKWLAGDVPGARAILAEAFAANPDSEDVWLAAFKLEFENNEPARARALLAKARDTQTASTARVWMKSAIVEREAGDAAAQRALLEEGIKRFPSFWKMWLMLGQLEEQQGRVEAARVAYAAGLKRCADCIPLWRAAAKLEEAQGSVGRARALLEQARHRNPKSPELWLAAIRTEQQAGSIKAAEALLAKGLQDCPASGLLWGEAVSMAPRPQRRSKAADAMKRCDNDPHVVAAVAQLFWADRKIDKARSWWTRAVTLDPDIGDYWAQLWKFEGQHGTPDSQAAVLAKAVAADPHHGESWTRVSKDVANAHLPVDVLLKKVVVDIDTLPPV